MRRVFLDTGALYALADRADTDHTRVKRAWDDTGLVFVTHDLILVESTSLITKRLTKQAAVSVIGGVRQSKRIHVVPVTGDLLNRSWSRFVKFADKEWDWVDCASFELMEALGMSEALALDHHFEQAGFSLL